MATTGQQEISTGGMVGGGGAGWHGGAIGDGGGGGRQEGRSLHRALPVIWNSIFLQKALRQLQMRV